MLTAALQHTGLDPSYTIGAELMASETSAHLGTGDVFVAEADESDGTSVAFSPENKAEVYLRDASRLPNLDRVWKKWFSANPLPA